MMRERPYAFVAMPFGDGKGPDSDIDFDSVIWPMYRRVIERAGLEAVRADRGGHLLSPGNGDVAAEMIRDIGNADVMVADVTLANPNVLYELGIRHSLRPSNTVITVLRQEHAKRRAPFNIQSLRQWGYSLSNPELRVHAEETLHARIATARDEPRDARVSPVAAAFPDLDITLHAQRPLSDGEPIVIPLMGDSEMSVGFFTGKAHLLHRSDAIGVLAVPHNNRFDVPPGSLADRVLKLERDGMLQRAPANRLVG
ncbi:MAG: hypothetical protein AAF211_30945, partial [Myxococcota bacterium]